MRKSIAIAFCVLATFVASPVSANTINLTVGMGGVAGDHILGEVFTRMDFDQAGGQSVVDTAIINGLLGVALGDTTGSAPEYYRSTTDFGVLPAATAVGASLFGKTDLTIVLTQVFQYLVVGYDGPNGGSQAYYIGDLAIGTELKLVPTAEPVGGHLTPGRQYGLTHSTLLNPGVTVPDGGLTISLLGMAMAGMGLVARRMKM